jgi:hypothetical protein
MKILALLSIALLFLLCGCSTMKAIGNGTLKATSVACHAVANTPPPKDAFPKPGPCVCGMGFWLNDGTEVAGAYICQRYRCSACDRRALVR